ncbi:extracellular solute-binding protein [Lacticaseibacillus kribbianus]|uniref:extracellular solute-binding protein n=1 Tax=Lacticaseibacillus kribbianus TaxID=2926292 RepID=UPI001CD379D2|nr:extracellular solute-binding protein [Lacticaseibacillus kribbianus]
MKLSKAIRVAGISAMSLLALAACGGKSSSGDGGTKSKIKVETKGFPIVKSKLTMTLMAPNVAGNAEYKDMPTLQEYAKKTGITLKYNTPSASDYGTKLNLAFASQDLPDIIYGSGTGSFTTANEITYGKQGLIVPLEKLLPKYAPNFYKLMKEDPNIEKSITTPDGHIYSLPMLQRGDTSNWYLGPMWYNGEWLKKLGVTELPKTTDEFYALLKRFKTEDPNGNGKADEIPYSDTKDFWSRTWLMSAFGMLSNGIQNNGDKVVYNPITKNYKEYLTFFNKLYKEGLLDKNTFTQSDDTRKAKADKGQIGFTQGYGPSFNGQTDAAEKATNPMWQPLTSSVSKTAVIPGNPRINRGCFVITKANPSPEASLRWIDYMYSVEGQNFMDKGPEGVMWHYETTADGNKARVFNKGIDYSNSEEFRSKITPNYGITSPGLSGELSDDPYQNTVLEKKTDDPTGDVYSKFAVSETKKKIDPYVRVPYPLVYLTNAEQDEVSPIANDLITFVQQSEAKFITGVTPLSDFDKFVKTIKSMNVDKYVSVYQAAYDRWNASN